MRDFPASDEGGSSLTRRTWAVGHSKSTTYEAKLRPVTPALRHWTFESQLAFV